MSSKFFTNQNDKDILSKKINDILKENHTYLDFLVGYIRLSGLKKIIENMGKFQSRILVGLSSDREIYQAINLKEEFLKPQIDDFKNDVYFMQKIQSLIKDDKLEIRITKEKNVHAKMYIFRNNPKNSRYLGSVIVGSSNLTHNGLEKSYELNTEIQDSDYIKDAVAIFDELWKDSQELTSEDVEIYIKPFIKKQKESLVKNNDIFYQSLIHYFSDIIDNDIQIKSKINLFEYQKDAINSAIVKINRYNGAILGDVVGLGKTMIAVGVLQVIQRDSNHSDFKALIIAPPAVHNQWKATLDDFGIQNYILSTYDTIPKDTDIKIIIIDESHKLKDHKSQRYTKIKELCKLPFRKKVLLLSATLQNNTPQDIANQVYLFQDKNGSNLPNIVSLEKFFSPLAQEFQALKKQKDLNIISEITNKIAKKIRSNILQPLLIRRTRTDIENHDMYKNDIGKFPKLDKLSTLNYKLGSLTDKFKQTMDYIENKITYERFRVLNNLNDDGKNKYTDNNPTISDNIFKDNDLSTLAKYSFIKRFESSFMAFQISLKNSILSLKQFIKDLDSDTLYVGANSREYLNRESTSKEYIILGNRVYYIKKSKNKEPENVVLAGSIFRKSDFKNADSYLERLKQDLEFLKGLYDIWKDNIKDPKLDKFLSVLDDKKDKRIVIFTEYSDTLNYIKKKLKNNKKALFVTSENRKDLEDTIYTNFDANATIQNNDYDILVTTDTLAEGVNLHRSNTLINYDLPWNPTKLMQRMGRINRIGSKFSTLNVSSFKPVDESNNIIGILEKSFLKLQSFHYTLGEDSKILFDDEEVQSFGILEDKDEELYYLQKIRDFKSMYPQEFEKLKNTQENSMSITGELNKELSFFKIGSISYFYEKDKDYKSIDFLTFIKYIENSKTITLKDSPIDDCIKHHQILVNTSKSTKNDSKSKFTKKDHEAMKALEKWYEDDDITEQTFDDFRELLMGKMSDSLSLGIISLKKIDKKNIQNRLDELYSPIATKIDILAEEYIKTKIFISLRKQK